MKSFRFHPEAESEMIDAAAWYEAQQAIVANALQLKPSERMRLINVIYGSVERPDATIDELWYEEAERRLAAYKAGTVKGTPAEKVLGERLSRRMRTLS